uniref:Serpentine receptor class gamma n=1 Tax=Panagrolaimus davidi TaxID=227884 RepID=A0A914PXT9_9BILA
MALNRFTIIWVPLMHERIWRRQWYILIIFILSFFQICWRLHEPGTFVVLPDNGSYTSLKNPTAQALSVALSSVVYITTTVIAAILNVLTIIKFYLRKNISSSNVNVNETRLFLVSFVIFIAQLLRTLCTVLRSLFPDDKVLTAVISTALPIISNIFAWSGSVSLLLLSPTTRKEYLSFYLCKKCLQIKTITFSSKPAAQMTPIS